MDRTAERNYEGELRRLKGEMHWRNAQVEAAEVQFREALEISRRQKAKTVELRATTSYARFLAAHGQADRARALVASVEAWFDEGKGGHDLAAARAVIDSLTSAAGSVEGRT